MSATRSITQADISRDTRLRLDVAALLAFPDGTVSARTLRAEAGRGKLTIFRIGKKFYTTLAEIDRMVIEQCPVHPKRTPLSQAAIRPRTLLGHPGWWTRDRHMLRVSESAWRS